MRNNLLLVLASISFYSYPSALACSPGSSEDIPTPNISAEINDQRILLALQGDSARALYIHLQGPSVKTSGSRWARVRTGYGISCLARRTHKGLQYSCRQQLNRQGESIGYFPFHEGLKTNAQLLHLKIQSPVLDAVFNEMQGIYNQNVNEDDGSYAEYKSGPNFSCARYVSAEQQSTVICEQYISAEGYMRGTGTDPMIGSGTQPVMIETIE